MPTKTRAAVLLGVIGIAIAALLWYASTLQPITLQVAMYPFIPDREAVLYRLAQGFEATHPRVHIAFVEGDDLLSNYYDGGLQRASADIYEIDTILLTDMKSRLLPVQLDTSDYFPEAMAAVTRDGQAFGIPHWLCSNFLFYRKGNQDIEGAVSWEELLKALANQSSDILVDLKGSSGLGEWYLTVLADRLNIEKAEAAVLAQSEPEDAVVQALNPIVRSCAAGFCRSKGLHRDRLGFYARAFVRGQHGAYIGYSESIYYGLQDAAQNCVPKDKCLTKDDIAVRRLPPFGSEGGNRGVGWVDALAIDRNLTGPKKAAAIDFIAYVTSPEAYNTILKSSETGFLRYLLPARRKLATESKPFTRSFTPRMKDDKPVLSQGLTMHCGRWERSWISS